MSNTAFYKLSNSDTIVHFERDIQVTELGKLFNAKLSASLGFEVVVSQLTLCNDCISIDVKERGVVGGCFGLVSSHSENNVFCMTDEVCLAVWQALTDSMDALSYPRLEYCGKKENKPYRLHVNIYDFVKRSRFGYFMDYAPYLQSALKGKYHDLSFSLRVKDDTQYYYLIFLTEADLKKAEEVYTIEEMNRYVWSLCRKDDTYHVFDEPLPMPEVTTRQAVVQSGQAMGIMRNNLKFSDL